MSKSILKSKTLLFQILSVAAAVSNVIPVSAEATAVIVAIINIGLRLVTTQPVTVTK